MRVENDLKVFGLSSVKNELNSVVVNCPLVFWYDCGFSQPQLGSRLIEPTINWVQKSTDSIGG